MITKGQLHEAEMRLIFLIEENNLTKEHIIEEFTNLINEATK